ncbi:MAG TPA: divalent-cation tolerance protein CutA [Methanocella sp.]|nr:divalent-cation tolerance protein CutA [Methanocella sp.]
MFSVVYIASRDMDEARRISRALVEERLVACANSWPITSVFRWEGALEEGAEAATLCKTKTALVPAVVRRVRELHSYEVPCITSWKIDGGWAGYLDWVRRETG